jgi:hypothetical protein
VAYGRDRLWDAWSRSWSPRLERRPRVGRYKLGTAIATGAAMQELRLALRGLRNRPGFALVVIATVALAVGVNTAIFSVVSAVLLKPLPYPHPSSCERGDAGPHLPAGTSGLHPEFRAPARQPFVPVSRCLCPGDGDLRRHRAANRSRRRTPPGSSSTLGVAPTRGRYSTPARTSRVIHGGRAGHELRFLRQLSRPSAADPYRRRRLLDAGAVGFPHNTRPGIPSSDRGHEFEDVLAGRALPLLEHNHQQGPLVPLGMPDADHRRLGDAGAPHGGVLPPQRDGGRCPRSAVDPSGCRAAHPAHCLRQHRESPPRANRVAESRARHPSCTGGWSSQAGAAVSDGGAGRHFAPERWGSGCRCDRRSPSPGRRPKGLRDPVDHWPWRSPPPARWLPASPGLVPFLHTRRPISTPGSRGPAATGRSRLRRFLVAGESLRR